MPSYRAEIQITAYIEVGGDDAEEAEKYIRDEISFESLAEYNAAYLDNVLIVRFSQIDEPEQKQCYSCGSRRWSDINGCAECGNLNDRWRA